MRRNSWRENWQSGWVPQGRGSLVALLCGICALEGADQFLLGATFHALQTELRVTPGGMGVMAMAQGVMIAVASPVWGLLADQGLMTRRQIISTGCFGWGIVTIALGGVTLFYQMVLLRALNGAFLGCLQPVCQGVVSDISTEGQRGRVFGLVASGNFVGMMATAVVVTPTAEVAVFGGNLMGWRVSYAAIGLLSLTLGSIVTNARSIDSTQHTPPGGDASGISLYNEGTKMLAYMKYPTFRLIVLHGMLASIPANSAIFFTMYMQLVGFSDTEAALIAVAGLFGAFCGRILGGWVADALATYSPAHGRPLTAQLSMVLAAPFGFFCFGGWVPDNVTAHFRGFGFLSFAFGLMNTWSWPGVIRPILSELVAPEHRVSIFSYVWLIEGVSGTAVAAPLVGLLSQAFGFTSREEEAIGTKNVAADAGQARALGLSIRTVCLTVDVFLVFLFFWVHRFYRTDADAAQAAALAAEQAKALDVENVRDKEARASLKEGLGGQTSARLPRAAG